MRDLQTGEADRAIARGIIALGHSLKLNVIAEGVETPGHVDFLAQAGCDEMHGYHVSRPLAADQLPAFLRARAYSSAPSEK